MADQWDRIHYPELSNEENDEIRQARRAGYAAFFPSFPSAEAQSRNTLAGARRFLGSRQQTDAGTTCRRLEPWEEVCY